MENREPSERVTKLTAALCASRERIFKYLKEIGRLPDDLSLPGGWIGMRLLIEKRGTDITLTEDEQLVYDAILRERRLPVPIILTDDEKKKRR